jgi:hypothetical protein
LPEPLCAPDVAYPGDQTLVDQDVAELSFLRRGAETGEHSPEIEWLGEDVRAESERGRAGHNLERRALPLRRQIALSTQD